MKESTLKNISLGFTVSGLVLLFILLKHADYPEHKSPNLFEALGKDIKAEGVVKDIRETDRSVIITVQTPGELSVIVNEKDIGIDKGDPVEVTGTVEEYNGRIYMSPREIRTCFGG